jgi:hypothetical protein
MQHIPKLPGIKMPEYKVPKDLFKKLLEGMGYMYGQVRRDRCQSLRNTSF